ncbi:putative methyltransferase NSUN7 [Scomber scombrus]|uniref:putative methyltransferase NSUN7 n=1 Tax=Scomber scombrus TaxID=13677 RepID=UPI002DD970C7|nr:putative methyltransferase NSUN7 [Scomber scombrus]
MVKNKNIGGRHHRSATCKTKKAGSQIPSSKDDIPPDDPADGDIFAAPPELLTTSQGQLGFPDRVYLLASVIFQNNHLEKLASHRLVNYGKEKGLPLPEVKDEMQHTAYELAFNTLKYQELLEDIMIDSCFNLTQPLPDDQMSLVAVMLYDLQDRKFLPRERQGDEEFVQEVRDVEICLLRFKTKLAASLARCRIKHDLLTIECILPESLKAKQERSSSLPLYAWVNALKGSLDEVRIVLKSVGLSQVKSIGQLKGQTFCQDPHCEDMLVFPAQLKAELHSTKLLSDHKLIIQDKFCSLGPNSVCSLLPDEGDVLMVGCFSGLTVSHTASLIAEEHKANVNYQPTVYVCVSNRTDAQREELQQVVTLMGCKNVKLIPKVFQSLDSDEKQLEKVNVILLTPKCSVSAISNPVEFILQENGDTDLLQDLSQDSVPQSKLKALVAQQRKDIDHALKFPKVVAVVYSTCSSYPEENEEVVSRALEQANADSEQEGEPKKADFSLSPSPFSTPHHAEGPKETDSFFMLKPSEQNNGCFLAVLVREPEPVVKEPPQEVLARANAKGILDRIGPNQPTRKEHHGHSNRLAKATHARNSQHHLSVSIQSKSQESRSSNSAGLCGHQEFGNKRESPQEHNTPMKTTTLHPAPPPASPVAPVVRPRRAHQEVLKPVVLVLPPVHFPNFFPPQHSRAGYSPNLNYNKWRPPAQTGPASRSSDQTAFTEFMSSAGGGPEP